MSDQQCQLCKQAEPEDVCIIQEMVNQISQSLSEQGSKLHTNQFTHIFKHSKFRKSLALIFDTKYLEICDKCPHSVLLQIFIPLWKEHNTENDQNIAIQLESVLDTLYQSIKDKQDKLKRSREQFDHLTQTLFNLEEASQDSFESSDDDSVEEDEPKQSMQFNKNSNKNKFQKRSIDILKKWFLDHLDNPYPDNTEKQRLSTVTGMHVRQIQNWFTNSRKRYLEPLKKKFENETRHIAEQDSEEQEIKKKPKPDQQEKVQQVEEKQQQNQQSQHQKQFNYQFNTQMPQSLAQPQQLPQVPQLSQIPQIPQMLQMPQIPQMSQIPQIQQQINQIPNMQQNQPCIPLMAPMNQINQMGVIDPRQMMFPQYYQPYNMIDQQKLMQAQYMMMAQYQAMPQYYFPQQLMMQQPIQQIPQPNVEVKIEYQKQRK